MQISKETVKLLSKFKSWDDRITLFPSGRFVISYRKKGILQDHAAVEGWIREKPNEVTTYSMKTLKSGSLEALEEGVANMQFDCGKSLSSKPVAKFVLSAWHIKMLKILIRTHPHAEKNSTRFLDNNFMHLKHSDSSESGFIVDDFGCEALLIDFDASTGTNAVQQVDIPYRLLKVMPRDEYRVAVLDDGNSVFLASEGGFAIYAPLELPEGRAEGC